MTDVDTVSRVALTWESFPENNRSIVTKNFEVHGLDKKLGL